jgi:hypothetical protein
MMQNGKFAKDLTEEKDKIRKDKKEEQKEKAKQNEWRIKISLNNLKDKKKKANLEFKYIDEVPKKTYKIVFYRSRKVVY